MEWKKIKLGDLCRIVGGGTPSRSEHSYWNDGTIKWISGKHITSDHTVDGFELITEKSIQNSTTNILPKGTLMLVTRVSIGKMAIADDNYAINQDLVGLIPFDEKILNTKYLFYFLKGITSRITASGRGASIKGVNRDYLKEIELPLPFCGKQPDIAEQKRIADKLDSIFGEIARGLTAVTHNDIQATCLKQSLLSNIFDDVQWGKHKLSDISDVNPPKNIGTSKLSIEVSFVPMKSVNEVSGAITKKQVRSLGAVIKGYTSFQNNDILFAKITPCMENGKCAIAQDLLNGIGFGSTEFYIVRPKESILPEYLWHFLRQERVREEAARHFTGAAGQKRVPKSFIENLELPVPFKNGKPDLAEQKRIITKLNTALILSEKMSSLLQVQEKLFANLSASVLSDIFNPEIQSIKAPVLSPIQSLNASPVQQGVALVLNRFRRGEMVVAKLLYIAQAVYKVPLGISFTPQALGPYSNEIGQAVREGLSPQTGFFARTGTQGMEVLSLGANKDVLMDQLDLHLKDEMERYLNEMMPEYFSLTSSAIELMATVAKIIEDEKNADDSLIRKKLQEWKPNKFPRNEVTGMIAFIKKKKWDTLLTS